MKNRVTTAAIALALGLAWSAAPAVAQSTTEKMKDKAEKSDVMATQQALKEKGFDPGPADGRMGPRTRAALRDYQKKEGLTATGRLDDQTSAKLGVRTSAAKPDTMTPSTAPSASPATPATPPNVSTPPPAVPEDKTAPPAKRSSP